MDEFTGLEIAIVGGAARLPGANSMEAFWRLCAHGRGAISTLTDSQLTEAGVAEQRRTAPGYVAAGGVLDDIELFDPRFFGLSPRDAAVLDPQQRAFLQGCWHALENAGYADHPERHLVGVYASASLSTYLTRHLLPNPALMREWSQQELVLANDKDTLATRVAYHLNLTGPALSVQTACSSSLVAVHLACQALLAGDCELALAGGVSIRLPQTEGYQHTDGGILSSDGQCRPFDAAASGTVGGNGVGVVVLKRLDAAVRDGDTVLAMIRASAINNDGAGKVGFTAPSVAGQAAAIRGALEIAEVDARSIGYVEAHGTATALGDPIEVAALTEAYRADTQDRGFCGLGSVKALVGHTDVAAGIVGLLKAVQAVRTGIIPPSPHLHTPNPELDLDSTPFYVNAEPRPWPTELNPRRAGISSFGMGGTNVHLILEQPPTPEPLHRDDSAPIVLTLSAKTPRALDAARFALAEFLAESPHTHLADVAHTLRVGRRPFAHRTAVVAHDRAQAIAVLSGEPAEGRIAGDADCQGAGIAFLFPGQGAQYPGMAAGLGAGFPAFASALAECADLLRPHLDADLTEVLNAPEDTSELGQTRYTQPALFAVEYALARQWQEWGVRPSTMLGHSVGEYVAACLAGVFELPDALALVAARGRLMQELPTGAMLTISAAADLVLDLPALTSGRLSLAATNAPELTVVSGPVADIEALHQELTRRGIGTRRLHTSHAFHSAMMTPAVDRFLIELDRIRPRAPHTPFVSSVTGAPITDAQAIDPHYWADALRAPVRFSEGLRTVIATQRQVLIEVGPGTGLATLARQHDLATGGHQAISSLRHPREGGTDAAALARAAARLWVTGVREQPIDLGAPGRRVPLPGYSFERQRCFYPLPTTTTTDPTEESGETDFGFSATSEHNTPEQAELSATEELVADLWRQLLGVPGLTTQDNFFELGGHSLLATQIVVRLRQALDVDIPVDALFQAPTVAGLARYLDELREHADDALIAELLREADNIAPEDLQAELDNLRIAEERQS